MQSIQLKQVGESVSANSVVAFVKGIAGITVAITTFATLRLCSGASGRGDWVILGICAVVGIFTLLTGCQLSLARERVEFAQRLFGAVEVHRTGLVVDHQPLKLCSKHRVLDGVDVNCVEFTIVLLEAIDRVTAARRSVIDHFDEHEIWTHTHTVEFNKPFPAASEIVANAEFVMPYCGELERAADLAFEELKRTPGICHTTYRDRSLTWLVRVTVCLGDGLMYGTTFALTAAEPLAWIQGTRVTYDKRRERKNPIGTF